MAMHVVGLFDDSTDAQAVARDLEAAGFDSGNIELHSRNAGGIVSRLTGVGVPENDANVYAEGVRRGGSLVTVHTQTDDQAYQAADIMNRHNIVDIASRGTEYRSAGWTRFDENAGPSTTTGVDYGTTGTTDRDVTDTETTRTRVDTDVRGTVQPTDATIIPVVEEELRVGTREVDRGGVRVDVEVEDVPVEEQVTLRDETVRVERRAVDRPLSDADAAAFQEGTFEVRETDEEAIVDKQTRVVEEVVIDKDVAERTETIRDTVRRTDVDVEEISGRTTGSEYRSGTTAGTEYQDTDVPSQARTTGQRQRGLTDRIEDVTGRDIDRDNDVAGRDPRR